MSLDHHDPAVGTLQPDQAVTPFHGLKAIRALRHRAYRWYWFSGLGMTAAQGVQQLALAWLVLDLTNSVGQLGLVIFMQGVPMALASFYGGMLADRYNRKTILLLAQATTTINLAVLAALTAGDVVQLWHVYISSIGLGLMQAITQPARNALIRSLVDDDNDMLNAVALNAIQLHSSRILWPSFAGGLISIAGVGITLGASAAFSVVGIFFLLLISDKTASQRQRDSGSQLQQMRDGVRYSFSSPDIATVMLLSLCCGLFGLSYMNLAPAFARDELGLGATGAGFFIMCMGIGAITGSGLLLFFPVKDGKRLFVILMAAFATNLILQAAIPWLPASFLLMATFGMSNSALVVAGQTFIQMNVPSRYLGRVVGLWSLAGSLGFITALPLGLIGDEVGQRWALGGTAALMLLTTVWFGVLAPQEKRLRRREASEATQ